jgi:hypothetical protein
MRYLALLLAIALVYTPSAMACGYHPGLANPAFDAVHPKSLSVAMAIRQATIGGVLETQTTTAALPTFAGVGYRRAVHQLRSKRD